MRSNSIIYYIDLLQNIYNNSTFLEKYIAEGSLDGQHRSTLLDFPTIYSSGLIERI